MTKQTIRSTASLILVTTALAWGLPVRADDVRDPRIEQEASPADAPQSRGGTGLRLNVNGHTPTLGGGSGQLSARDSLGASSPAISNAQPARDGESTRRSRQTVSKKNGDRTTR